MAAGAQRYTAVAIVLHWAIAFAILLMIPLGFWMHISAEHGNASDGVYRAFQLHKSIGLTVLALSLVRLGWRLANPTPPLPEHMPAWERFVARATHWAFYALMIGLPLSGWLYVSTGWSVHDDAPLSVATHYFGLFTVPALFGLNQASDALRSDAAEAAFTAHWVLAYAAIGLAALHVLAALKHHLFDKDDVLAHMIPGLRAPFEKTPPPKNPGRLAVLGVGLGVSAVALASALFVISGYVSNSTGPAPSTFEVAETPGAEAPPAAIAPLDSPRTPAAPSTSAAWRVNAAQSAVRFEFTVDDGEGETRFEGRFTRWRADIRFDPNKLENAAVTVTIDTASADDGVPSHNAYLPQAPWFNTAQFPTATFTATDFRRSGSGYEARGELTVKGRARNATLPFTLVIDGDTAVVNGQITIDRRAYGVGSDTEADDMVSRDIQVNVRVEADARAMSIAEAVRILREGGLVVFPTETVYGLGADATNAAAVARIYAAKGRPQFNPLISHISGLEEAKRHARLHPNAHALAEAFWPGPLTVVAPRKSDSPVAELACAGLATIALRAPAHPLARDLIDAFGGPIVAPSANTSGHISATTAQHAAADLGDAVDLILDGGPATLGLESTIVAIDANGRATLLRPGAISRAAIEAIAGPLADPKRGDIAAPGMMESHYAPRARIVLDAATPPPDAVYLAFGAEAAPGGLTLSVSGDLTEAASNLYAHLRALDATGAAIIAVAPIPGGGLAEAIRDRLARAATPR